MAFTKALFYPTIDISNEAWLKNAMLYWDNIYTIVPFSFVHPYQTRTAQEFADAGLLLPLHVHPQMSVIEGLTDDILKYFDTPEGEEVLMSEWALESNSHLKRKVKAETLKLQAALQELAPSRDIALIHRLKFSSKALETMLSDFSNEWVPVDRRLAQFYMTLLATRLSESIGAGLLTYAPTFDRLATVVKIDAPLSTPEDQTVMSRLRSRIGYRSHTRMPSTLAQGTLANLTIEQIEIDPDTSVRKILQFRKDHSDQLGRFRTKIAELTATISEDQTYERLHQQAEDIYKNEVKPAINSLKAGLTDNKILWGVKGVLTIAGLSTSSLALITLAHLAAPYILLADAGILLSVSAIQYNRERADKLRNDPYSFVLAAEKAFPSKG